MADMGSIEAAAQGLPIIEDCAQAHGARRNERRAGSFGRIACFSFFPTKNLGAIGDGGAVLTSDSGLADKLRRLRQYGWQQKYTAVQPGGRNSRLDELQAAILRLKLPHLEGWNARRRQIIEQYRQALPAGAIPAPGDDDATHLAVARIPQRDRFRVALAANNVATDIHYPMLDYRQPALAGLVEQQPLIETERAVKEIVTLPCFPEMTDEEVERAVHAIRQAYGAGP
jgi:dTDP-4-amino-4,6-dideoxygalactose transaminase